MEEEEGGRFPLKKKPWEKDGEVDYKTKAGTAWSHSFLNQKPWHPLSYPNQRRKWIAEQTDAQKQRRAEEISREYAQEQDFLKQTALVSKKEKEKLEMMKAVSFMYVKPPGYNPESAKAAEMADEIKKDDEKNLQDPSLDGASSSLKAGTVPSAVDKKKGRPKDVFGRALPTEEQFEVLKNAPRLETGVAGRSKPFGVEIRNVKCLRCGNFGHQSGDRECPMKDAIMPNEESRLKRDDPLTAIQAQTDSSEPLKWELKQKPGMSPPRGGFDLDDPNQQIVAEDIFDEYGGFLGETIIPELLTNNSSTKKSRKNKHTGMSSPTSNEMRDHRQESDKLSDDDRRRKLTKGHKKKKPRLYDTESSSSESSEDDSRRRIRRKKRSRHKHSRRSSSSEASDSDKEHGSRHRRRHRSRERHHRHRHRRT
ncbi:uncharacterized zinc finger CCHC domain-containing protein At4g19190 [Andrographis paniculata]|uniref:uncharacterized zinc finger CCHC domain-containing protein At4g19190 n=1 Tax=Andrographis paniculata TaxID=175694 RepID=UPI0021E78B69|nr:uncharacterized zinc finger CCHC domain-containing protein At4g19190 [Andrographis paniculata]